MRVRRAVKAAWGVQCGTAVGFHDKVFRNLMKQPGTAEALVRERLPRSLARRVSGAPVLLSESFVEASLRSSFADLIIKVPLRSRTHAWLYCIVEHKRSESPRALVQVLRYVSALYAWLDKAQPSGLLAPVLPLIIFNGERPWRGPTRFRALHGLKMGLDFEVILVDLGVEPPARVSKHPMLKAGLLGLKAAATPREKLEPLLAELLTALRHEASTRSMLVHYLSNVLASDALPTLRQAVVTHGEKEPEMQTIAQYLEARGRRKGLREGLRKGTRQGKEDGLRDALTRLLDRRFKRIPPAHADAIREADEATLNRWFDTALTAKSLRAVFAQRTSPKK